MNNKQTPTWEWPKKKDKNNYVHNYWTLATLVSSENKNIEIDQPGTKKLLINNDISTQPIHPMSFELVYWRKFKKILFRD